MFDSAHAEMYLRLALFGAAFMGLAVLEMLLPRRRLVAPKAKRWATNLGVLLTDALVVRLVFPAAAVGMAVFAEEHRTGLLHFIDLPHPLEVALAFIALDLAIYLQHVMFHAVPLLWRVHRAHHADLDLDVTTGVRFHPAEILLSMVFKAAVILALGVPVLAAFLFEAALNITSMFSHSNLRVPQSADSVLRKIIVTPDMHRVHHSLHLDETNHNFGFNLSLWDYLLGTYQDQPRDGHADMVIGIPGFREHRQSISFLGVIAIPFMNAHRGEPHVASQPASAPLSGAKTPAHD
jgi:sterol desaturase/sphingolipid hydroxylase (fatty acid hydroxylase superfamily)